MCKGGLTHIILFKSTEEAWRRNLYSIAYMENNHTEIISISHFIKNSIIRLQIVIRHNIYQLTSYNLLIKYKCCVQTVILGRVVEGNGKIGAKKNGSIFKKK